MRLGLGIGLLMGLLPLAGCASGPSGVELSAMEMAREEPPSVVAAPGPPVPFPGSIRATVVDDAGLPLDRATVAVLDLQLDARTDPAGGARFENLAAGEYQVGASRIGYGSAVRKAAVYPEQETVVVFVLAAVPIEDLSYAQVYGPLQGYFECRASLRLTANESWTGPCGTVCANGIGGCLSPNSATFYPNDNAILRFTMTSPNLDAVVGDMQWAQSAWGTSTELRFAFSHDGRNSAHWWCSAQGRSPLQFQWLAAGGSACTNVGSHKEPPVPAPDQTLRMYANTPFGTESTPTYLTLQQRFEIVASLFYGDLPPPGYSGFDDR